MILTPDYIKCKYCDWKRKKFYYQGKKIRTIENAYAALSRHVIYKHSDKEEIKKYMQEYGYDGMD